MHRANENPSTTKAEIRRAMRQRLRELGADRAVKSRAICEAISAHSAFGNGAGVAVFASLPSEPDLASLWTYGGVKFCYPRVSAKHMEFVEVEAFEDLVPSSWNPHVHEPGTHRSTIVSPAAISLILVPGLAFTAGGLRLGRGGGFYDRFLAQLPVEAVKLGVCFDCQVLESLPMEPHDQVLDMIVTESGFIASSR